MRRDPSLIPLSHQHQHGLALSVLIDRGLKEDHSPQRIDELYRKVAAMVEIELLHHFQVEEEVLFPAVREETDCGELVDELLAQHGELKTLADRLASADPANRARLLGEFADLLSRHIRIEERQLFERIQAQIPPERLRLLGRRIGESVQRICPSTEQLPWERP